MRLYELKQAVEEAIRLHGENEVIELCLKNGESERLFDIESPKFECHHGQLFATMETDEDVHDINFY